MISEQLLCEHSKDELFDLYVDSWFIYHRAADRIDGHIFHPRNKGDVEWVHRAAAEGGREQEDFLISCGIERKSINKKIWQRAKKEALRRLDKRLYL